MIQSIRISRAYFANCWVGTLTLFILTSGCAHRAPSLRLLDGRAGYDAQAPENEVGLFQGGKGGEKSLLKSNRDSARIYLHPTKLPSGDWFWGGYITLSLKGDSIQEEEFSDSIGALERPAVFEVDAPNKVPKKAPKRSVEQ